MAKGNVLVVGNSGVGKSTLINAVLGENKAAVGFGIKGTSSEITVYEGEGIDFNLIDTVGFEPPKAFWEIEPKTVKPVKIIPVIAEAYYLTDSVFAPPEGITELIDLTNNLMPEGIRIANEVVAKYKLERRRAFAQSAVLSATAAAATVGAVPVPFADALLLQPIEVAEINGIAAIYGIRKSDQAMLLKNTIVEVGTISTAAKAAISALKTIPGLNIGMGVINAVIASGIVAALGEGSIYVFEQIYLGNRDISDIDWVKKIMESQLAGSFIEKLKGVLENVQNNADVKDIAKQIYNLFVQSINRH